MLSIRLGCFALASLIALSASAAPKVAIVSDGKLSAQARHGIDDLEAALRRRSLEVVDCPERADYLIFAGGSSAASAAKRLKGTTLVLPQAPESLAIFRGQTNALIPLYAVGVFVCFTLSQAGMVVHWLRTREPGWRWKAALNGIGQPVIPTGT